MKNLIHSYLFGLKKGKLLWATLFLGALFGHMYLTGDADTIYDFSAGRAVAEMNLQLMLSAMMSGICAAALVVAADFDDKTINYEIMSGHSRFEIFAGRAIVGVIIGMFFYLMAYTIPVLIVTAQYGFGTQIAWKEFLFRSFMSLFPVLRILCEFIFITLLVRNAYIIMGASFVLALWGGMVINFMGDKDSFFLGISSLNRLCKYESWMTYTLDSKNLIYVYDHKLSTVDITGTILSSLLIGAAFLVLAYYYLKKDDLR